VVVRQADVSTLLLPIPRLQGRGLPSEWSSRILVAADGRESSDAAISMAWTLSRRSVFDVVSVLKTSARGTVSEEARAERVGIVEAQLNRLLGALPDGDMVVEAGSPADVIATAARLRAASLLVIGIGTCPVRDRLLGEELALAIARRSRTPMFAVAPGHLAPPQRIVIGIDFSAPSFAACEAALEMAGRDALIVLANIADRTARITSDGALWRLVDKVQARFNGRVTAVERHGDPASQLLEIAAGTRADTIAIGGHGQTRAVERALGPVATRIVRCSPVSVLLVPANRES
jgi:nucleotide-binding universal stress UspA family protein